jgi:NAD(P)-dependent dehydrogenase (short-subunit alcohol dehydrogenase family)
VSKLEGRVAVVTGAASGIGAGIATAFAREGADVVVADKVSAEQASDVIAAIKRHGREALFVRTDVSDEASVRAMAVSCAKTPALAVTCSFVVVFRLLVGIR